MHERTSERTNGARATAAAVKLRYVVYSNVPSSLWRALTKNLLQCVSVRKLPAVSGHGYQTPCTKIQPRAELTMELSLEDKLANNKKFSPQRQVGIMARSVGSPFFSNSSVAAAAVAKGLHSRIAEDQRAALLAFRSRCFGILATRKEGNFGVRERGTAVKAE